MRFGRIAVLAAVAACVSSAAASEGQAGGGTPITTCGQVVTTNAYLTQNLHCTGSSGVVVGADEVTVDLKGFRLRGDGSFGHSGIDDNGFDSVTIKNGTVRTFASGVRAYGGADRVSISGVVASGNDNSGVEVDGDAAKIKSVTASGNLAEGVVVTGDAAALQSVTATGNQGFGINISGGDASLKSSTAAGNSIYGIIVDGEGARLQSSSATGNGSAGIVVNGDLPSIKGNTADGNGFDGGSDLSGPGIEVSPLIGPTGTNAARGNDDPAECAPVSLC